MMLLARSGHRLRGGLHAVAVKGALQGGHLRVRYAVGRERGARELPRPHLPRGMLFSNACVAVLCVRLASSKQAGDKHAPGPRQPGTEPERGSGPRLHSCARWL